MRSDAALTKIARLTLDDGTPAHSFCTLMAELATIVRNTCRTPQAAQSAPTIEVITSPNAKQQRALKLLRPIKVYTETGTPLLSQLIERQGTLALHLQELQARRWRRAKGLGSMSAWSISSPIRGVEKCSCALETLAVGDHGFSEIAERSDVSYKVARPPQR